jgi:hypothetical protein
VELVCADCREDQSKIIWLYAVIEDGERKILCEKCFTDRAKTEIQD